MVERYPLCILPIKVYRATKKAAARASRFPYSWLPWPPPARARMALPGGKDDLRADQHGGYRHACPFEGLKPGEEVEGQTDPAEGTQHHVSPTHPLQFLPKFDQYRRQQQQYRPAQAVHRGDHRRSLGVSHQDGGDGNAQHAQQQHAVGMAFQHSPHLLTAYQYIPFRPAAQSFRAQKITGWNPAGDF